MSAASVLWRVKGHFFEHDGVPLHYTDEGAGEPVVLLHGFCMHADLNWRRYGIVQQLARRYRVIAMDLRGHGLSGKPHAPSAYGLAMVEDVRALLDHLGLERVHLVGFSTGGFMTLKFLTRYPVRLLSASATGMAYRAVDDEARAKLERIGAALETRGDFRPLMEELDLPSRGLVAALRMWILGRLNDTQALAHLIRAFPEFEVAPEELARNEVPMLSMAGTLDPIAAGAEEMHHLMANHRLVWLEGGDKLSCLAMPEFVASLERHMEAASALRKSMGAGV